MKDISGIFCQALIGGEGHVLTAGGLDTHIHFICPQIATVGRCRLTLL